MAQDIRKMFENDKVKEQYTLPKRHRKEFSKLLENQLPEKKQQKTIIWSVAATVLVLFGVGLSVFLYQKSQDNSVDTQVVDTNKESVESVQKITLGDISPDLKKVEDYYVANINLELADIDIDDANKRLLDGYMNRLSELNDAYIDLTIELNDVGPNNQTINALINNLQLRLQLLYRLKEKIKELKQSKNEKFTTQNA